MSKVRNYTHFTLVAALLPALWSWPAFSESGSLAIPGQVPCAKNMSCMTNAERMSFIVADGPKMSLVAPDNAFTLSACTKEFHNRPVKTTISVCEGYLDRNTGTARDRATAMLYLGHALMRNLDETFFADDVSANKTFQIWTKAVELDPNNIEPLLSIGNMFGLRGDIDRARAAFDKAEKIDPKDWRVYTGLANAYFYLHTYANAPNALKAAEKAAAIKPDKPYVMMVYGRMLEINGRDEESAKQYEAAIGGYDPLTDTSLELMREPHPWQSLASVYKKLGKPALAAETMSKYLDSIPAASRDYALYSERAEYYELAGLFFKAAADFKEASLRAPPEYAADLTARQAMLLAKAGAKSSAGEELRSVLARGSLKPTLKIQVFLRNQGYLDVTINGKYDSSTKRALDECLQDKACAPIVGQAI
jgi:tetratricopeptide (TPR) repeat protein